MVSALASLRSEGLGAVEEQRMAEREGLVAADVRGRADRAERDVAVRHQAGEIAARAQAAMRVFARAEPLVPGTMT